MYIYPQVPQYEIWVRLTSLHKGPLRKVKLVPRSLRYSSARCVRSEVGWVSHLLDWAFLRQALLQLLLQLLPGAQ